MNARRAFTLIELLIVIAIIAILAVNDGRYVPDKDILSSRHNQRANVGFADGHAQSVKWQFGDDVENTNPNLP